MSALGVDWAAFNLHKWIGAPVETGALYMRRGTLEKVAPYPGEQDPQNASIAKRVHSGTINFAARLPVPAALDYHEQLGPAVKEARLRYLRSLWTDDPRQARYLGGFHAAAYSIVGGAACDTTLSPRLGLVDNDTD